MYTKLYNSDQYGKLGGRISDAVNYKLPCLYLLGVRQCRDPEVIETVLTALQGLFSMDFIDEELDKVETESLEAKQRQATNDACYTHVVVRFSTTTATTNTL